ncbi:hypothetical protein [Salinimicrobium marinum]|nr:hypothetical protein [Salinimicrobium marinum]
MSAILELDKLERKLISVLYRLTLVAYSIFLLSFFEPKINVYYNVALFVGYLFIFNLLRGNSFIKSTLRLLMDFIVIFFVIWQVGNLDIFTFSLLFIPVLNSQNHTGPRKTILLYIIPLMGIFILDKINGSKFTYWYSIPFLAFLIVNSFTSIRTKYYNFHQNLNDIVDRFFEDSRNYEKSHIIYRKIIKIINNKRIFLYPISDIVCFRVQEHKLSLVNGSSFIWNTSIKNEKDFIKKAKSTKSFRNHELELDEKVIKSNLVINCHLDNHTYSYIFVPQNEGQFIDNLKTTIIINLFTPFLYRYSRVLRSMFEQKKNELSHLNQLQEKINYVTNSVNSMHFIRNKLGPLKNYLAMVEDYEKADRDKRKRIEPYLKKERTKISSSITSILQRAEYILKKSNNPFNVYKVEKQEITNLFTLLRSVWSYMFDTQTLEVNWDKNNLGKFLVQYNDAGLELVLSNWISNMLKNHSGKYGVVLGEEKNFYSLDFYNSTKQNISSKFIEDFNNSNREMISRRETHGLIEIKDFISQMDLDSIMYKDGDNVHFVIMFKKYERD